MARTENVFPENVESFLDTLGHWLYSEMSIAQPEEAGVDLAILVRNDAPPREDGMQVVFMGVGLNIIDTRDPADTHIISAENIVSSRPSDQQDLPLSERYLDHGG